MLLLEFFVIFPSRKQSDNIPQDRTRNWQGWLRLCEPSVSGLQLRIERNTSGILGVRLPTAQPRQTKRIRLRVVWLEETRRHWRSGTQGGRAGTLSKGRSLLTMKYSTSRADSATTINRYQSPEPPYKLVTMGFAYAQQELAITVTQASIARCCLFIPTPPLAIQLYFYFNS